MAQAKRRNSTIYVISTSLSQDMAALGVLKANQRSGTIPWLYGNCSDRSNDALDAAGIVDTIIPNIYPGSAGSRAEKAGASIFQIPKGSSFFPKSLEQFNSK